MLKAIDTRYNGYRFRSRLEARWAVFFDALGIEWEYEPEGYLLPSGKMYLPDFVIMGNIWAEIKPRQASKDELDKLIELVSATRQHAIIVQGYPSKGKYTLTYIAYRKPELTEYSSFSWHNQRPSQLGMLDEENDMEHDGCARGYDKASGARFEFGEDGT